MVIKDFLSGALAFAALALAAPLAEPVAAQSLNVGVAGVPPVAGSPEEDHLLLLQLLGRGAQITSAIRPFTPTELDQLAAPRAPRSFVRALRPDLTFWYNTSRPYSENDGVVWTGRGATAAVSGGFAARTRWLWITVRPVAFWTQNAAYPEPLGDSPKFFGDPYFTGVIDQPYRFGPKSYGRIDTGESTIAVEVPYLGFGLSSATQVWGPMHVYPLLLGNNAGGFPHVFVGTSKPVPVFVGTISMKAILGRLERSAFAPARDGDPRRAASGLIAEFSPAFLPGLDVGAIRFFHRVWPQGGLKAQDFTDLFQGFLKSGLINRPGYKETDDNQLASVFFRVSAPSGHAEVYGEYLREDHSLTTRDLIGEPDHSASWALGVRHAWTDPRANRVTWITVEALDAVVAPLVRFRAEGPMYVHSGIDEGHTYRGQILGSPAAYGGRGLDVQLRSRQGTEGWSARAGLEQVAENQEGGSYNGDYLGFYRLGGSRSRRVNDWDVELGLEGYLSWKAHTPGNNLRATISLRPL